MLERFEVNVSPVISALYVDPKGCYAGLEGVDLWDEARDARKYAGPWPVVAHPPCQRWGRYWSGGPMLGGTPRAKKDIRQACVLA